MVHEIGSFSYINEDVKKQWNIYAYIILPIKVNKPSRPTGGFGRLRRMSWLSAECSSIISFNLTAVCIFRTWNPFRNVIIIEISVITKFLKKKLVWMIASYLPFINCFQHSMLYFVVLLHQWVMFIVSWRIILFHMTANHRNFF